MLLNLMEYFKSESIYQYPQKGIVISNDDPKKLGRIKCTIKNRWEETNKDKLPWVFPVSPYFLGGRADLGCVSVPEVNTEVQVTFPFEDEYSPFYTGYWISSNTKSSLFDEDYPDVYGIVDSTLQWLRINKKNYFVEFFNSLFNLIKIDKEGNLLINVPKSFTLRVDGDFNLAVSGNRASKVDGGSILKTRSSISIQAGGNYCVESGGNVTSLAAGSSEFKAAGDCGINAGGIAAVEGSGIDFNGGIVLGVVDGDVGSLNSLISNLESKISELGKTLSDLQTLSNKVKAEGEASKSKIKG